MPRKKLTLCVVAVLTTDSARLGKNSISHLRMGSIEKGKGKRMGTTVVKEDQTWNGKEKISQPKRGKEKGKKGNSEEREKERERERERNVPSVISTSSHFE